jgi:hypothetical protein
MGIVNIGIAVKDTKAKSQMSVNKGSRNDLRAILEQLEIMKRRVIDELIKKANIVEDSETF